MARGMAAEMGGLRSTAVAVEVGRGGEWCGGGLGTSQDGPGSTGGGDAYGYNFCSESCFSFCVADK